MEDNEADDVVPDRPLLHDMEHYIRSRAIEQHSNEPRIGHVEAQARANEAEAYQNAIHQKLLGKDEEPKDETKAKKLESFKEMTLTLLLSGDGKDGNNCLKTLPLVQLASSCDTIFSLASSAPHFDVSGTKELELSLVQFDSMAVREFVSVVLKKRSSEDISGDHIIECCKIAHFLQAKKVLDDIEGIINRSIDSQNCMSICQLADQLHLPSLFESSLSYMLSSLDNIQKNDMWDDFPRELQNRVLTMRNAVQSSILGRGQRSKIFFTSSEEFLAIFSDNIRDQKERLQEAKKRQADIIREREQGQSYGFLQRRDPHEGSVADAKIKIEKQEKRIRTLELFYQEQKMMFSRTNSNGGTFVL